MVALADEFEVLDRCSDRASFALFRLEDRLPQTGVRVVLAERGWGLEFLNPLLPHASGRRDSRLKARLAPDLLLALKLRLQSARHLNRFHDARLIASLVDGGEPTDGRKRRFGISTLSMQLRQ